jgi:hypothetical protein
MSTGRHFQNGHHNTAQIQHCPISKKFFDVRNQYIQDVEFVQYCGGHFENGDR